jgi:iron complex outermembrane recepter protein
VLARPLIAAVVLAPLACGAQDAAGGAGHGERIEVTGSNIKRSDMEGPAPLLVLRREDLEARAGQNLHEILIGLPYANFGSFAESRNGAAAGVSLRGMGADSTLVLVDGLRVAVNGFFSNPGTAFVNLNTIPTAAIERIEVLKDGASAIYGADAVAGVVNIILRKDFQGAELTGTYGESSRGDTGQARGALILGTGSLEQDKFNAMLSLEYYHRDRLAASQRERSRNADQRPNGGRDWRQREGRPGTWLTESRLGANTPMPGCPAAALENAINPMGVCAHNENEFLLAAPRMQRKAVVGRAAAAMSPAMTAFVEASWVHFESETGGNPAADRMTLPRGNNSNPFPFGVDILHRWLELGPRFNMVDTRTSRFIAGVEGSFRGVDFEGAVNRVVEDSSVESINVMRRSDRQALVEGNVYSFLDPSSNDPALLDAVRVDTWRSRRSTLESAGGKVSGPAFELPAGPISIAAGLEWRREGLGGARDANHANYVGVGSDSNETGNRTVVAVYVESTLPLVRGLELQLAARGERYSDFGDSTAPKVAFAWRPSPAFLLRGGYSEGFRAPSLYQLHVDARSASVPVVDAPRCDAYTAAFGKEDLRTKAVCGLQMISVTTEGNPSLRAADSTARTLGLIVEPAHGLSIGIDAFDIRHRNRVVPPSAGAVIAFEDSFPGFTVMREPPRTDDLLARTRGPIVSSGTALSVTYLNAGTHEVRGADLELRWRVAVGPGVLQLESLNTRFHSIRSVTARGQPLDLTSLPFAPRYRGWHQASWTQGSWRTSAVVSIASSSVDSESEFGGIVESWTTVDLQAGFAAMKNLVFIAGVRNVADRTPPFVNDVLGFDESTHSIVGRSYYVRAAYRF